MQIILVLSRYKDLLRPYLLDWLIMKRHIIYDEKSHWTNSEGNNINPRLVVLHIPCYVLCHIISEGYVIVMPEATNK